MPLRILVADDNPSVVQMVRTLLELQGFEIVGLAADGSEAVALAQTMRPDVAVLDLDMPQVNGLDAARQLRAVCPATHLILLSAYSTQELVVSAFRTGIRGYVVKSDSTDDLVRAIREVSRGGIFLSPSASRFVVVEYLPPTDRGPGDAR